MRVEATDLVQLLSAGPIYFKILSYWKKISLSDYILSTIHKHT